MKTYLSRISFETEVSQQWSGQSIPLGNAGGTEAEMLRFNHMDSILFSCPEYSVMTQYTMAR